MDPTELLQIGRDKSIAGRRNLALAVSNLFREKDDFLSDWERTLMIDILHRLVHDFEISVRRIISKNLADWPNLPPNLANFLANDDIEVAYPVLSQSGVLQDMNLIEVIRHRTMEHQMAITIRQSVSEEVSDALVEEGNHKVITQLLANSNAMISQKTMEYLVEESKQVDSFREPILRRKDLDPNLAQRMFMWVSVALRQFICNKYDLDQDMIDDLLEKSALEIYASQSFPREPKKKSDQLVDELAKEGEVTPELLIDTLHEGEVHLFISLFKRLSKLREQLIQRFIFESGGEGLAIACKSVGITKADFSQIFALCQSARLSSSVDFGKELRAALKFFDNLEKESADQVVKRWRRDPKYLAAIRDLELGIPKNG